MGLDIYAGTLTRYYSHNWKTVVQQWAEENGYTFNQITPDGEPADNEEERSPAEVQAAVENWRDQILSAISQPGQPSYACLLYTSRTPEGRAMLKKAIALLKPHEEYFEGDYYGNFRMGYSYYYLDQELSLIHIWNWERTSILALA